VTVPYDFEHVICSSIPLSQQQRVDASITNFKTLNFVKNDEKSSIIYTQMIKFSWPFNQRITPCVGSIQLDEEKQTLLFISKPTENEVLPDISWGDSKTTMFPNQKGDEEISKNLYKMFEYKIIFIEKLKEKETKYTQINLFSLGGWIKNDIFIRDIILNRGNNHILGLIQNLKRKKSIESIGDLKSKKFFDSDGLSQLLVKLSEEKNEELNQKEDLILKSLDEYTDQGSDWL
jgi:hypothetical protein